MGRFEFVMGRFAAAHGAQTSARWRSGERQAAASCVPWWTVFRPPPLSRALPPSDGLHPDIGNGGDVAHWSKKSESGGKGRAALMLRCVARTGPFI